jgi:ELWxxDGT repeat protein
MFSLIFITILFFAQSALADLPPSLVKDLRVNGSIVIQHPTIQTNNGTIYFFLDGNGGAADDGLYKTDGTDAGTVHIKHLAGNKVVNIVTLENKLIFSYSGSTTGTELWVSDGTTSGTHIIEDLNPGTGNSVTGVSDDNSHSSMLVFNNFVYFGGTTKIIEGGAIRYPSNLYRTDGNTIERVKEIHPRLHIPSSPHHFVVFNHRLFFTANTYAAAPYRYRKIWSTDGTALDTKITIDIGGNGYDLSYTRQPFFKVFKNKLCFAAKSWTAYSGHHEIELWCAVYNQASDEYIATQYDINPLNENSFNPPNLVQLALVTNDFLYFSANDGTHGNELWAFSGEDNDNDGEIDLPYMLKDINVGAGASFYGYNQMVVEDKISRLNGAAIFAATSDGVRQQLWKTNGTVEGTAILKDFSPDSVQVGGSNGEVTYQTIQAVNGRIYFSAKNKLWQTDGLSTRMLTDALTDPRHLSAHGDYLYFTAEAHNIGGIPNPYGNIGRELFKLDPAGPLILPIILRYLL